MLSLVRRTIIRQNLSNNGECILLIFVRVACKIIEQTFGIIINGGISR